MGTFFNRVINVPNVPGSNSKIDHETRHKPAKPVTKAKGARNAATKNGVSPPIFEEQQGFFIVTFKASLVEGGFLEEGAQKSVQKST